MAYCHCFPNLNSYREKGKETAEIQFETLCMYFTLPSTIVNEKKLVLSASVIIVINYFSFHAIVAGCKQWHMFFSFHNIHTGVCLSFRFSPHQDEKVYTTIARFLLKPLSDFSPFYFLFLHYFYVLDCCLAENDAHCGMSLTEKEAACLLIRFQCKTPFSWSQWR